MPLYLSAAVYTNGVRDGQSPKYMNPEAAMRGAAIRAVAKSASLGTLDSELIYPISACTYLLYEFYSFVD